MSKHTTFVEVPLAPFRHAGAGSFSREAHLVSATIPKSIMHDIRRFIAVTCPLGIAVGPAEAGALNAAVPAIAHVLAMCGQTLNLGTTLHEALTQVYAQVALYVIRNDEEVQVHQVLGAPEGVCHAAFLLYTQHNILPWRLVYTSFSGEPQHTAPSVLTADWAGVRDPSAPLHHLHIHSPAKTALPHPKRAVRGLVRLREVAAREEPTCSPFTPTPHNHVVAGAGANEEQTALAVEMRNAPSWWAGMKTAMHGGAAEHARPQQWSPVCTDIQLRLLRALHGGGGMSPFEEEFLTPASALVQSLQSGSHRGSRGSGHRRVISASSMARFLSSVTGTREHPTTWVSEQTGPEAWSSDVLLAAFRQGCMARGIVAPGPQSRQTAWCAAHAEVSEAEQADILLRQKARDLPLHVLGQCVADACGGVHVAMHLQIFTEGHSAIVSHVFPKILVMPPRFGGSAPPPAFAGISVICTVTNGSQDESESDMTCMHGVLGL